MITKTNLKRVLIVGAGFGGLRAATALRSEPIEVLLIDRNNYHLFQPLLYQVATAGLEPEQVARPVRGILRGQENFRFLTAEVEAIDFPARRVITDRGDLTYDYLILAPGAESNSFGLPGIAECALHLKDLDDAVQIRNHILRCFERATWESQNDLPQAWLTFLVVGGGPTGVEMAGSLAELVQYLRSGEFHSMGLPRARIILAEMAQRLLPEMQTSSSKAALESLSGKGVEVWLGRAVRAYDGFKVEFDHGEYLEARTLIWAAGVSAAGLLQRLDVPHGPLGRVAVLPTLQLEAHPEVYVIGDGAYIPAQREEALPMMAPVATQMAERATANIRRDLRGQSQAPFRYKDPGRLATIGRNAAVAEIGRLRFRGFLAWVVWLVVHLIQLVGFRNRLMVLISWAWEYLTYERAVRLIQGRLPAVSEAEVPGECS
ncbi:MAG: NAD(P)/FAD-dependent oxidoreductase [Anaerolineales bacterium]|nr:NAD(P)/FAD-dependent oxidoreductase [Anaerolineales bacterium]